jgi:hypothetical protein
MSITIKYNIYLKTPRDPIWRLVNPTPITHDVLGNSYTITSLGAGITYQICLVAGILDGGTFVPLMSQSFRPDYSTAGDVQVLQALPMWTIRTGTT